MISDDVTPYNAFTNMPILPIVNLFAVFVATDGVSITAIYSSGGLAEGVEWSRVNVHGAGGPVSIKSDEDGAAAAWALAEPGGAGGVSSHAF